MSIPMPIRNISDTALWVAVYRADESDRPDAVFRDPHARRLAGERGEMIVQSMANGRKNSWSIVARTWLIDQFVLEFVHDGCTRVLNLACGLDTRPYRLPLPETLTWIDADLPEVTSYMNDMMADQKPNCTHQRVSLDLADREARLDFFHELAKNPQRTIVITEGLLVYLPESEVSALAYDLSHTPGLDRWIMDLISPAMLPLIAEEMGTLLTDAKTPLVFAPEEGEDFFRLLGWRAIASKSRLKTAASLHRLSDDMMAYAKIPEPPVTSRQYPWAGICVFERTTRL